MVKSCFDDKRYILDDGINSLSYFKVYWKNKSNLDQYHQIHLYILE